MTCMRHAGLKRAIPTTLGILALVQFYGGAAAQAASRHADVTPLAYAALQGQVATVTAHGVTASLTVGASRQCGAPMVWQPAEPQPAAQCKVARLIIKNTTGQAHQAASFLLSPYGVEAGMSHFEMALYQLDASSSVPQVMVAAYTGGAHCCEVASLFGQMPDGTWRETPLGQNDGDSLPTVVDAAHNGTAQIEQFDQSFLYTFASYAGSYAPLVLLRYQAATLDNVTRDALYRPYLAERLKGAQKDWVTSGRSEPNGFLAYYVATNANMGTFAPSWRYMMAHKDTPTDSMFGISECDLKPEGHKACTKAEQKALPYPQGLALFLVKTGYISAQQAQAALSGRTEEAPAPSRVAGQYKPDFSCMPPPQQNGVAVMLCQNSDAARHELQFDQVYYALRKQVGPDGWKGLKQEVILDENAANESCGLPIPGQGDQSVPDGAAACYGAAMERLADKYRVRLKGIPAAEEEAARSIDTHIALQQKLIDLGYLPAGTVADGVYGESTRTAIETWQRVTHRPEVTGFLSQADATALLPAVTQDQATPVEQPAPTAQGAALGMAAQQPAVSAASVVSGQRYIWNVLLVAVVGVLALALYMLPFAVACLRDAPKKGVILALTVLLGWTCVGWIGALLLALAPRKNTGDI